jgi:outer membrane protein assembly factor BamB
MKNFNISLIAFGLISLYSCSSPTESESSNLELLWKVYLDGTSSAGLTNDENKVYFHTGSGVKKLYMADKESHQLAFAEESYGSSFGIPVIDNNSIYTGGRGIVAAYDKNTLNRKWYHAAFEWEPIVAVDENNVYCTAKDTLVALDKATGTIVWSRGIIGKSSSNCKVNGNRLYFATGIIHRSDGYLYCIDKNSGETIFKYTLSYMESRSQFGGSSAGVEIWGDYVYVPSDNRNIYCLNKYDGTLIWEFLADSPMETPPVVSDGVLYTGSLNRTCYAIDASTGKLIWSYQTVGSIRRIVPQFYKEYVMFVSGAILIFNKNSGELIADVSQRTGDEHGYFAAVWDVDGKIYSTGYEENSQKEVFLAHQF